MLLMLRGRLNYMFNLLYNILYQYIPIGLVTNHIDSGIELSLEPSMCIISFAFPPHSAAQL